MNRRQFLYKTFLAGSIAALPYKGFGLFSLQNNFIELRRNVGYYTNRGGTIGWLADSDALVVVDSQFPSEARAFINGIGDFTGHPVDLLINTHHHGDHTGGNGIFRELTKTIVAHKNVPRLQLAAARARDSEADQSYPTMTYKTAWKFDAGDEIVHARYFGNAHTGGDSVVYFEKANVVHMGDLVFNRIYPFIDRPGEASVRGWISLLERTVDTYPADAIYIFGHGREGFGVSGDRDDVITMQNFLEALVEHVQNGLAGNKSRDEIISLEKLPGFPDHTALGNFLSLRANLEVTYEELTNG